MSDKFEFKYSAPTPKERKEIESIRKQYTTKDEKNTKLDRLRYLDNKVKNIPMAISISSGVIGTLIFGLGLTFFLEWDNPVLGIIFAVIGIVPIVLAHYSHRAVSEKLKKKYTKEILELSEELLKEENN